MKSFRIRTIDEDGLDAWLAATSRPTACKSEKRILWVWSSEPSDAMVFSSRDFASLTAAAAERGEVEEVPSLLAACEAVVKALDYRDSSPDPTASNYVNPAIVIADRVIAEKMVREAVAKAKGGAA